jgi:hypothetical protein
MRFQDFVNDLLAAFLTMTGLAVLCSLPTYIAWNNIIVPLSNFSLHSIDLPSSLILNLTWNFCAFFKLQKRDVIVAHPINPEESHEEG